MDSVTLSLLFTAISLGFIHTLLGPDHYVPFIALAKSNGWSLKKTLLISSVCGIAHCLSSVVIGFLGIGLGIAVGQLELIEGYRGDLASYLMIAFGLAYFFWALRRFLKKQTHVHSHQHGHQWHSHEHAHKQDHLHAHATSKKTTNLYWGIFIVFLFGPCEPLIPLLMYPAAQSSVVLTTWVALTFTLTTVLTMLFAVSTGYAGLGSLKWKRLSPYSDLMASSAIILCGVLIILGL